eukprot:TRINITY_DN30559_c0_g1_i1.p1 TRINITY_DN30559_c0_g1~~TRINITY_DN30559_c0_g1_i1.p1  ORF type:complete len:185 (+),score=3.10 TRINITY_DN30559_c0_g1_i1:43-555(+)
MPIVTESAAAWAAGFASAGVALYAGGTGWMRRAYATRIKRKVERQTVYYEDSFREKEIHWIDSIIRTTLLLEGRTVLVCRADEMTSDIVLHPIDGAFAASPEALSHYFTNPSESAIIFCPTDSSSLERISGEGYIDSLASSQPELLACGNIYYINQSNLKIYPLIPTVCD